MLTSHDRTSLKKVAEPIDVANQIAIMASSKVSGHVTGEVIMVTGGVEGKYFQALVTPAFMLG